MAFGEWFRMAISSFPGFPLCPSKSVFDVFKWHFLLRLGSKVPSAEYPKHFGPIACLIVDILSDSDSWYRRHSKSEVMVEYGPKGTPSYGLRLCFVAAVACSPYFAQSAVQLINYRQGIRYVDAVARTCCSCASGGKQLKVSNLMSVLIILAS